MIFYKETLPYASDLFTFFYQKFPLPHSRGSSHGQSRGIRKAYPDPFFTNIMEHAYKEWRNIEQLLGKHEQIVGIDQKEPVFLENDQLQVENRVYVYFLIPGIKLIK